ncbi:hypothetical protein ABK040_002128 [Willaertia magna]
MTLISFEELIEQIKHYKQHYLSSETIISNNNEKEEDDEAIEEVGEHVDELNKIFHNVQTLVSTRLKKKDSEKVLILIQSILIDNSNHNSKTKNKTIFKFPQFRKLQKNISKNFGAQIAKALEPNNNSLESSSISQNNGTMKHKEVVNEKKELSPLKKSGKKEKKSNSIEVNYDKEDEEEGYFNKNEDESNNTFTPNSSNIYHVNTKFVEKSGNTLGKEEDHKTHSSLASQADIHELYQYSVQSTKEDIYLFEKIYKSYFQLKAPHIFREDFCGTALLSTEWAKRSVQNVAIGVDIDKQTIEWGWKHNVEKLNVSDRVKVFCENVLTFDWESNLKDYELLKEELDSGEEVLKKADIICAYNYSVCLLHKRKDLIQYFTKVKESMSEDGSIFLFDLFGGSKIMSTDDREYVRKDYGHFLYEFEQTDYNPVTEIVTNYIHFKMKDNSWIKKAFSFKFRKWGILELKEILDEVGFSKVDLYWARHDKDVNAPIEFKPLKNTAECSQGKSWTALFVALK